MKLKGTLIKGLGGLYEVKLEDGTAVFCKAKGAFRHESQKPYIGDRVILSGEGDSFVIEKIDKRENCLIRPPISNVGVIFITFAAAEPEPVLLNIDKLTCISEHNGIRPVITVTKSDIAPKRAEELSDIYSRCGYKTFVSGSDGEALDGIKEYLRNECRDEISCFAGASGVGKSTLMTSLFPKLQLETGQISKRISRGKHTTRHVQLYPLSELFEDDSQGYIADTPGFSLLDFVRFEFFDKEVLPNVFPEFESHIGSCRYTKCTHLCEEGCAICQAVNNGEIPRSRHESYVSIYSELKGKNRWK